MTIDPKNGGHEGKRWFIGYEQLPDRSSNHFQQELNGKL